MQVTKECIELGVGFGLALGGISVMLGYCINQCLQLFKVIANK